LPFGKTHHAAHHALEESVGRGFPGLAHRVLGHEQQIPCETFDIHGGGMDLIFRTMRAR